MSSSATCATSREGSSQARRRPRAVSAHPNAAEPKTSDTYQCDGPAVCVPLISSSGHGKASLNRIHYCEGQFALADLLVALKPLDASELDARFLYRILDARKAELASLMRGAANVSMKPEDLAEFEIPLPPLEEQAS